MSGAKRFQLRSGVGIAIQFSHTELTNNMCDISTSNSNANRDCWIKADTSRSGFYSSSAGLNDLKKKFNEVLQAKGFQELD